MRQLHEANNFLVNNIAGDDKGGAPQSRFLRKTELGIRFQ